VGHTWPLGRGAKKVQKVQETLPTAETFFAEEEEVSLLRLRAHIYCGARKISS
jgi:hypothetical protein